ncbi:MFS transporter, AAHS family, 4-hydroxybenzoate transporter [Pseudomonas flavescens]|uniref:MFS transporter, AAHS family, 4-hydroxybenzoate transporter n=1 Tax=Phytopseudomonas flavescens TaxID=29435 RepID=A0A1G8JSC5_9GAMM|nr:MFS transporter [Pseudomonas flavescens]SDI33967.1 MFS transporter, AAHS family, 4-hydroxybenzoate transporter [Pseudomonas flavescens]
MTNPRTIDVAALIEGRKLTRFNYVVIAVSVLITFLDGFDLLVLSHTASYIADEVGLDKLQLGEIFSVGLFGMMLGGFFFGYLGDRIGRRPTIIFSTVSFGVLTLLFALADSYASLMVLRFCNGFALGAMLPLCWALNIEFVPKRYRSTVVTIIMVGFSLGSAMAGPLTVWLAPHIGWQGVFIFGGLLTLLASALLLFTLPESVRFLTTKRREPEKIARILKRLDPGFDVRPDDRFVLLDEIDVGTRNFRVGQLFIGKLKWITPMIWIGYSASSMAMYFLASWSPLVYTYAGFDRATASWVSSIASFAGAMAGLAMMRFVDTRGPYAVMIYPLLALPFLLVLGITGMQGSAFLILSMVGAVFVKGSHYGILSIAGIFYPSAIRANGAGWATSIAKIGSILGPLLGAYVLNSGLPVVKSFLILAICPAVLALCAFIVGRIVDKQPPAPPLSAASQT